MISEKLLQDFRQINDEYYYVIEYYLFQLLKVILTSDLSLRDSYTIFVIHQQQKLQQNTSTTIAKLVGMSPSSFSNHLRILEKNKVIIRHRDEVNRKLMVIELTAKGRELHKSMMNYFRDLFFHIHSKIGLQGDVKLLQTVLLVANHVSDEPPLTAKLYQPRRYLDHVIKGLVRLFFYFSSAEEVMLKQHKVVLTLREVRFLQAVYVISLETQATPTTIGQYLGHPMSTVTSLINSLSKKMMLERVENDQDRRRYDLVVTSKGIPYVESFMRFRVQISHVIFDILDEKHLAIVNTFVQGIKDFSMERLRQYESA